MQWSAMPNGMPNAWKSWRLKKKIRWERKSWRKWLRFVVGYRLMLRQPFMRHYNIIGLSIWVWLPNWIPGTLSIPDVWIRACIRCIKNSWKRGRSLRKKYTKCCSLSGWNSTTILLRPKWGLRLKKVILIPIFVWSMSEGWRKTVATGWTRCRISCWM